MNVNEQSVRDMEKHAQELWDATVTLMAAARRDGAKHVPSVPLWADLNALEQDRFIYSESVGIITAALTELAVKITGARR